MVTVFVLTVVFLIQEGQPYTATFGGAHKTMAECEREQARGAAIVKEQKFKILESKCEKMSVRPVYGKFEVDGRWITLP